MSIDLTALSVAELEQLVRDADQRVEALKRESCAALRLSLEAQAREAGFDIYAMFGGMPAKLSKHSDMPKYRNPQDPEQIWGGIGKRPEWLRAAINAGESLESMRIR